MLPPPERNTGCYNTGVAGASHPPAWYRDPRDPARVRRWDGSAWTDEVRPVPDWLRTLRLSAGPSGGPVSRRRPSRLTSPSGSSRRLWWASGGLLLAGALVMAFLGLGETTDDADRLRDRAFARAADGRCAETGSLLGPDAGRVLSGPAEVARIERITSAWEVTAVDLRSLPVVREDAARVDRWLSTWERWVGLGHEYAEALRTGADDDARSILAEADAPMAELRRFAVVNGMDDCAFG